RHVPAPSVPRAGQGVEGGRGGDHDRSAPPASTRLGAGGAFGGVSRRAFGQQPGLGEYENTQGGQVLGQDRQHLVGGLNGGGLALGGLTGVQGPRKTLTPPLPQALQL